MRLKFAMVAAKSSSDLFPFTGHLEMRAENWNDPTVNVKKNLRNNLKVYFKIKLRNNVLYMIIVINILF